MGKIEVLEVGTCSGISAMYLLAGMAFKNGGHLTSFEGSSELAKLASGHIEQFIAKNKLNNVSYEIIVGSLEVINTDGLVERSARKLKARLTSTA